MGSEARERALQTEEASYERKHCKRAKRDIKKICEKIR
jgi:hypothetical protein